MARAEVSKLSGYGTSEWNTDRVGYRPNPRAGKPVYSARERRKLLEQVDAENKRRLRPVPAIAGGTAALMTTPFLEEATSGKLVGGVMGGAALAGAAGAYGIGRIARHRAKKASGRVLDQQIEPETSQVWMRRDFKTGKVSYHDERERPVKGAYRRFTDTGDRHAYAKRRRSEQAAGVALAGMGASRIKGVGRMLEVGSRTAAGTVFQKPMKAVRTTHKYAGTGYDIGSAAARATKAGAKVSDTLHPYTPHAVALVGTGLVAHGSKRKTVQGW